MLFSWIVIYTYKNRYRLMNWILGFKSIRKYAVAIAMRFPLLKEVALDSTFGELTPNQDV